MGDVLAHLAVAARGGLHQAAVLVAQVHGQAVELGLGNVLHGRRAFGQFQLLADACVEGLGSRGLVVGLGADAEHGHGMAHGHQAVEHGADHALRGRVRGDQFGVGTFQRLQLLEDAVVLAVGHGGRVQHVVLMCPLVELGAQRLHLGQHLVGGGPGLRRRGGCAGEEIQIVVHGVEARSLLCTRGTAPRQLNSRRASMEPADSSRLSSLS